MFDTLRTIMDETPPHIKSLWNSSIETLVFYETRDGKTLKFQSPQNGGTIPESAREVSCVAREAIVSIGATGWDWDAEESVWVNLDLDDLVDHSKGVDDETLARIIAKCESVPEVEIVRSKGGRGYHLRIFFSDPKPHAPNRKFHIGNAQRARVWLAKTIDEPDLATGKIKVDSVGGKAWLWHRETKPGGFELIKRSTSELSLPEIVTTANEITYYSPLRKTPRSRHQYQMITGTRSSARRKHSHVMRKSCLR